MKKILLLCLLMLSSAHMVGQNKVSSVILKNGTVIKGYIKSIDPTDAITIEISGIDTKIKMDNIALIENANENGNEPSTQIVQKEKRVVMPDDPLAGFSGFLLAKGNNVYVYGDDSDLERMCVEEFKKYLMMDGFWNVVDHMNEAHFTINYLIYYSDSKSFDGYSNDFGFGGKIKTDPDKVRLSISSWRSNAAEILKEVKVAESKSKRSNLLVAKELYEEVIVPLQKKIGDNKTPARLKKRFTIK